MATLSELQADLVVYRAARDKILLGQEYAIGGQRLRRPDLAVIEKTIKELEMRIAMATGSGQIKTGYVVFGGNR